MPLTKLCLCGADTTDKRTLCHLCHHPQTQPTQPTQGQCAPARLRLTMDATVQAGPQAATMVYRLSSD